MMSIISKSRNKVKPKDDQKLKIYPLIFIKAVA